MKQNMGLLDARIRTFAAIALLGGAVWAAAAGSLAIAAFLAGVAVVFLVTSRVRVCPLYMPLRVSTAPKK